MEHDEQTLEGKGYRLHKVNIELDQIGLKWCTRAAQLLDKSQLTVAEIAYTLGFNNPKYFTQYFKPEFGSIPSAYRTGKKMAG